MTSSTNSISVPCTTFCLFQRSCSLSSTCIDVAVVVGLLLELELLRELLLVLCEFVQNNNAFFCLFFSSFRESEFLSYRFWHKISFSSSRFRWCSFDNLVLLNLYSLIEVIVSCHVLDNPGTVRLAVIRRLQSQSRMLAPDTPVRVPVPHQFH